MPPAGNIVTGQIVSLNGSAGDVAAFFRVSLRTVRKWVSDGTIERWREGGNLMFPEEAVVKLRVSHFLRSGRATQAEAEAVARSEWRAHLKLRGDFQDLANRVAAVERALIAA